MQLLANINLLSDLNNIENIEIDGIGLFRTEFPFIIRKNFPSEEEQFVSYKKLFDTMQDKEVTIRTLDIGGDKIFTYGDLYKERNPFLGCRAIRFCMQNPELFKTQLRAILRASSYGNVKIMFPMISTVEELIDARKVLEETMGELEKEGIPFNKKIQTGN